MKRVVKLEEKHDDVEQVLKLRGRCTNVRVASTCSVNTCTKVFGGAEELDAFKTVRNL